MAERLLVVDDEPDILLTVALLLESTFPGVHVTTTPSAIEARKLLDRDRFDLVITDYRMPGMDGAQLVQHIRGMQQPPKVIMCTAYADHRTLGDIEQRAPGLPIFHKPIVLEEFLPYVRRLLA